MAEAVAHNMPGEEEMFIMSTEVGVAKRTPMVALVAALATKAKRVMLFEGSVWCLESLHTYDTVLV